jgi:hypothetical protein
MLTKVDLRMPCLSKVATDTYAKKLRFENNHACSLFLLCQPLVQIPYFTEMRFLFEPLDMPGNYIRFRQKGNEWWDYHINVDIERHVTLSKEDRYLNTIEHMQKAMCHLTSAMGWDNAPFEMTFKRMRAMGCHKNSFILGPLKSSNDKKFKATREFEISDSVLIQNVVFLDEANRVVKRVPMSEKERRSGDHNLVPNYYSNRDIWISNEDFAVGYRDNTYILSPYRDGGEKKEGFDLKRVKYDLFVCDEFWKMRGLEYGQVRKENNVKPKLHYDIVKKDFGTIISLRQKWDNAFYDLIKKKKIDEIHLFYTEAWVSDNSLSFLELLKDVKLRALRIADETIEDITPIHYLTALRSLTLDTAKATVIDLQYLPDLEEIYLLRRASAKNLEKSSLKRLRIYDPAGYDVSEYFRFEKLETLTLGNAAIKDLTDMKNLRALKQLKLLDARQFKSLQGIEYLTSLEQLQVNDAKSIGDFELIQGMKKLKFIDLRNCGVIRSLEALKNIPTLEEVYLGDTNIADGNMRLLKTLPNIKYASFATFPHYNLQSMNFRSEDGYDPHKPDREELRIEFKKYQFPAMAKFVSQVVSQGLPKPQGALLSDHILEHMLAHLNSKGFKIKKLIDIQKDKLLFKKALPELLRLLEKTELVDVKTEMVKAITHRWLGPEAAPILVREFKKSLTAGRTYGLYLGLAIRYAVTPEVLDDLILIVQDRKYGMNRDYLIYPLQKLAKKNSIVIDVFIEALKKGDMLIEVLRALGNLKVKSAEPFIEPYLSHEGSWVRAVAARALEKIREK